jgi:TRAP-type C4-dicarboxylate transport system substrate-binding protein
MKRISLVLGLILCAASAASALEMKIASIAPDGSQWMQQMRKGAAEIRERTGGRVVVKFYGGGVMGNEKSVLRKMRVGQLHGGVFTSGGLDEVYPDLQLYSLLLTFRNMDEVDYIRQRLDRTLLEGMEQHGLVSFGFAGGGFAQLMATFPVRSSNDLKGRKFWVPEGDKISYAVAESLGLTPVTLPITDVMTGLQTGLIDSLGTSPIGVIAFQWHTKLKYVNSVPLAYLMATLVVDKKFFDRLSSEDQAIVREVMGRVYQEFDQQNRIENQAALKTLQQQGLVLVDPLPGEENRWRELAATVNNKVAHDGTFSPGLFEQLQQLLAQSRAGTVKGKGK